MIFDCRLPIVARVKRAGSFPVSTVRRPPREDALGGESCQPFWVAGVGERNVAEVIRNRRAVRGGFAGAIIFFKPDFSVEMGGRIW